ncbi:uncharacterized protein K460DRAFT_367097 [Cucurbitaria berberidis CBS 394.84]|uniref:Aminoglycoside phosphotransferase domain-containing protein n=1 Tax=Cucurbitaria berberidis CBS 394.84 TaxID=1168544 RepID=A0A9P4L9C7_9PLEO|nr:uncharacterized protein K460DRAFT_367097 [Cucurbitaria berberidis CBS 394.84]KAF1846293.1 hypothetical protein K460DRAFT_367097 [Cucurbitaria berberidis CBS 394.84]
MMKLARGSLTSSEAFESEDDYIQRMEAQSDITFFKTYDITYEFTATTFTKTSRLPIKSQRLDGTPFVWYRSWNHERITNEARALEIVLKETKIPVPRLLAHGSHPDGRRFLITEFIEGPRLDTFPGRSCSKPEGQEHTNGTSCKDCSDQAYANALDFISGTVMPQLATMKSQSRGIDGFVMPPSWLSPDIQPPWTGKERWKTLPLKQPEYVFQHGDIAAHNIIMDPRTLKVKALIDFEYAGFYPPGMENWTGTLCPDAYNRRSENIAHLIKQFLATEYVECYDKWSDKMELNKLTDLGKLPHPDQVRQDGTED